jgi:hypothetical protein
MLGEGEHRVGFLLGSVGLVSGFLGEPDISFTHLINGLRRKCRVCQVFLSGESRQGFEKSQIPCTDAYSPLIIRDLNDAPS